MKLYIDKKKAPNINTNYFEWVPPKNTYIILIKARNDRVAGGERNYKWVGIGIAKQSDNVSAGGNTEWLVTGTPAPETELSYFGNPFKIESPFDKLVATFLGCELNDDLLFVVGYE